MHIGKFVFAQITQFLPQRYFNRVVAKYNDRTRGWSMSHWNHLLVLMFGQLMGCGSLRELTDYTDEKIFREDAMSGWAKKELKDEKIKELNADFTEEKTVTKNLPKGADWFGMMTNRRFNIRLAGTEDVKTVNYNGAAIDVSM